MEPHELTPEAEKTEAGITEAGDEAEKLLGLKRVAEVLGVSTPTARRLATTGKLAAVKIMVNDRLCWKVKPDSLKRYVAEARNEACDELSELKPRLKRDSKQSSPEIVHASNSVPLEAHQAALETAKLALERLQHLENQVEEHRTRADQVERQKFALEMELRQYQAALTEQSESLAEARAEKQAAESRLDQLTAIAPAPLEKLKLESHRPTFGQRVKGWLGFKAAR